MRPIHFRIAALRTAEDIAAVAVMFREYAAGLAIDLAYQDFDAELAALPGKYAPPAGALLLARGEGGRTFGCVGLRRLAEPGVAEIKRLYVAPAARGLGVGAALVAAILDAARQAAYGEARLDTLPDMRAAMALYERAGFARTAPYYDTPVAGTVFFARRLEPRDGETPGQTLA